MKNTYIKAMFCHTCVINLIVHEYITPVELDYITNGYLAIHLTIVLPEKSKLPLFLLE